MAILRGQAFEEALDYITSHEDVWVTTGREIAEYYREYYFKKANQDIENRVLSLRGGSDHGIG